MPGDQQNLHSVRLPRSRRLYTIFSTDNQIDVMALEGWKPDRMRISATCMDTFSSGAGLILRLLL